jgi:hypothetical protein
MKLFLDTEFTDLRPGAKLISIALVDENENYFYAELTDTWNISDCSLFVKTDVLPYLKGAKYQMSWYKCAAEMCKWIEERNEECMLAMDNPGWDFPFLKPMLDTLWPPNLLKNYYLVYVLSEVSDKLYKQGNLKVHNALDDALVMKRGTLDS